MTCPLGDEEVRLRKRREEREGERRSARSASKLELTHLLRLKKRETHVCDILYTQPASVLYSGVDSESSSPVSVLLASSNLLKNGGRAALLDG